MSPHLGVCMRPTLGQSECHIHSVHYNWTRVDNLSHPGKTETVRLNSRILVGKKNFILLDLLQEQIMSLQMLWTSCHCMGKILPEMTPHRGKWRQKRETESDQILTTVFEPVNWFLSFTKGRIPMNPLPWSLSVGSKGCLLRAKGSLFSSWYCSGKAIIILWLLFE